jgi:hypothetical protein
MTRVGHSALALANSVGAVSGIENAETGSVSFALAEMARAISPRKTWGYLVSLMHVHERVAKHRLNGTRRFTDEDIALLLRSERGIDYLVAIMGDAEPAWWQRFKKHVAVAEAARMQRAARRKLQEAIDADADLSAAITRAAVLQDEDFHRPQVDALRASGGLQNRAVASATKRR